MTTSAFRTASELLVQYAHYHRDPRNIATHFVGIPMIVFALGVLMARVEVAGISLAAVVWLLTTAWYLSRGLAVLAVTVSLLNGALIALAHPLAAGSTASWLSWGLGTFFVGWVLQFVGHYWEGRKPAFVDDLIGLLVGPMFVVAEALFAVGWGRPVARAIVDEAGPVRRREPALTRTG